MSDIVRIVLRGDDSGAYTVGGARGVPDELAATLQRFRSADVVLDGAPATPPVGEHAVLQFVMASPSPLGHGVVGGPHDALVAFAYHAHDDGALLAFDERITDEYTRFYATRGIRYAGVYRVEAHDLGLVCWGEILAYDGVHTVEEGDRLGNQDLPPNIVAIEDECRTHQDRAAPRVVLWLFPSEGA
jgi:hypothetical protein